MIAAIALLAIAQVPPTFRGVWTMTDGTPVVVPTTNLLWIDWPNRSIEASYFKPAPKGGVAGAYGGNANLEQMFAGNTGDWPVAESKSLRTAPSPDSMADDFKLARTEYIKRYDSDFRGFQWEAFPYVFAAESGKSYGRVFWTQPQGRPFRLLLEDSYGSKYLDSYLAYAGGWEKIITTGTFVSGSIRMTLKDENAKGFVKLSGTLTNGTENWTLDGNRILSRGCFRIVESSTGAPKGTGYVIWTPSKAQYGDFAGGKWEAADTLRVRFNINRTYPNGYDAILRRQG
ncbi:MAG: hypothetical protein EBQ89_00270 [Alphaproteobacteria bacterium]|nr:hypothetical protein [Alphaproteobacteria bacterium]